MSFHHQPRIVTNGLVLYLDAANPKSYPGDGSIWHNLYGVNIDASITGYCVFNNSMPKYFIYDGNDGLINCGKSSSFDLTSQGTMDIWIYTDRNYPSDTAAIDYRGMIAKTFSGGAIDISYFLDWYGNDSTQRYLRFQIGDGSTSLSIIINNYSMNNKWHSFCGTWDSSILIFYDNGIEIGRTAQTLNAKVLSNQPLHIGRAFNSATYTWEGNIGVAKLYNRGLSSSEVLQNFNALKSRYGL